jgi:hypothetical protein
MSIRITRVYAEHSGETKFYQVFKIQDTKTGRGAVVTHWGALTAGASKEPRYFGQSKVATGTTFRLVSDCYNDPIKNKRKRGYSFGTEKVEFDGSFRGASTVLATLFKDADVKKIEDALLPDEAVDDEDTLDEELEEARDAWESDADTSVSAPAPTPQPDTEPVKTTSATHDEWGTW